MEASSGRIARVQIDGKELSFPEALWLSMLRTMDPGTMGGDEGAFFLAASLLVTIGGVLVVSSLIGLLACSARSSPRTPPASSEAA